MKTSSSTARRAGFSLIEIMLAMGVISIAMVGLMGLVPLGLKTFKESVHVTVQSQILQTLISEAQLQDWSGNPAKFEPIAPTRYFDGQGKELEGEVGAQYKLTYTQEQVTLPGVKSADLPSINMAVNLQLNLLNLTDPRNSFSQRTIVFNPGKVP